jgi:hypothetical protein
LNDARTLFTYVKNSSVASDKNSPKGFLMFECLSFLSPVKNVNIQPGTKTQEKQVSYARHRWLTPIILATPEAEIRRITV